MLTELSFGKMALTQKVGETNRSLGSLFKKLEITALFTTLDYRTVSSGSMLHKV